jgi:hypothetical protein
MLTLQVGEKVDGLSIRRPLEMGTCKLRPRWREEGPLAQHHPCACPQVDAAWFRVRDTLGEAQPIQVPGLTLSVPPSRPHLDPLCPQLLYILGDHRPWTFQFPPEQNSGPRLAQKNLRHFPICWDNLALGSGPFSVTQGQALTPHVVCDSVISP